MHHLGQAGQRDGQPVPRALDLLGRQHHPVAGLEIDHAAGDRSDPQLRARHVLEHGDVAAHGLGGGADPLDGLGVLGGIAMREVEPGDVHSGRDHALQHPRLSRRGPHRRDDLRRAHPSEV